jgi:hypothetical protein
VKFIGCIGVPLVIEKILTHLKQLEARAPRTEPHALLQQENAALKPAFSIEENTRPETGNYVNKGDGRVAFVL